jgi:hypothetical protein
MLVGAECGAKLVKKADLKKFVSSQRAKKIYLPKMRALASDDGFHTKVMNTIAAAWADAKAKATARLTEANPDKMFSKNRAFLVRPKALGLAPQHQKWGGYRTEEEYEQGGATPSLRQGVTIDRYGPVSLNERVGYSDDMFQ